MTDIINTLAQIAAHDPLDTLRDHRLQAKDNAQLSFEALLEPEDPGTFSYRDRYTVAAFTAGLLGSSSAEGFYRDLLRDEDESASMTVATLLDSVAVASVHGPYAHYESAHLTEENTDGPEFHIDGKSGGVLGSLATSGLEFAHLLVFHPRDSRPEHLARLFEAGWDEDGIVTLAQLVSFLNFQIRIAMGLAALEHSGAGTEHSGAVNGETSGSGFLGHVAADNASNDASKDTYARSRARALKAVGNRVSTHPNLKRPLEYQQSGLGWVPWIAPVAESELSEVQREALVEAGRAKNPYFRLLARDPAALQARTLTDFDIFFNTSDGLGRAERELAATVASRLNGCLFCASVHSARASEESGLRDTVQMLLDDGVGADDGVSAGDGVGGQTGVDRDEASNGGEPNALNPVWTAVVEASIALTRTPQEFGARHVTALHEVGLDDGDIIDVLNCAAFFN